MLRLAPALLLFLAVGPASAEPPDSNALAAGLLADMKLDVKLALVDPGAAPRSVVRYRPVAGASTAYETASRSAMEVSIAMPDGQTMALPLGDMMPAVVVSARNTVGKTLPNGMTPVRVEQLGTRLDGNSDPEVARAMSAAMGAMQGMSFDILLDAAGKPVQIDVGGTGDPAMTAAMQSMADQMSTQLAHFPTEAIGKGAKWTVDMDMSVAGMDFVVHQTCTLLDVTANGVDVASDMLLDMGKGAIELPGMPPGIAPEITRFEGSGSGTMHIDLTTLVSTGLMTMDMDMGMSMAAPDGGGKLAMAMKIKQTTEMRPAK